MYEALFGIAAVAAILVIAWQVFALVGDMAVERGHSPWPWWILSVCWSPFGSMIVMWLFFTALDEEGAK